MNIARWISLLGLPLILVVPANGDLTADIQGTWIATSEFYYNGTMIAKGTGSAKAKRLGSKGLQISVSITVPGIGTSTSENWLIDGGKVLAKVSSSGRTESVSEGSWSTTNTSLRANGSVFSPSGDYTYSHSTTKQSARAFTSTETSSTGVKTVTTYKR